MRIFITGGTGFIGKALCGALSGHELLLLRPPGEKTVPGIPCRLLDGDLNAIDPWSTAVGDFAPQACVHLAWEGLPDYSVTACQRNFSAAVGLLHFLRQIACPRVVVTGTCWEYGNLTGSVSEEQVPQTIGQFAAFKTALRLVCQKLLLPGALVWARPFFVYGPGQKPASLIPSLLTALSAGQTPDIRSPDAINDFIHVQDVGAALAKLATTRGPAGIYNLGSTQGTRVRDVVNIVARFVGRPEIYPPTNEPGVGFWADTARMLSDYGWMPSVALEDGIRQTIAAWRAEP